MNVVEWTTSIVYRVLYEQTFTNIVYERWSDGHETLITGKLLRRLYGHANQGLVPVVEKVLKSGGGDGGGK